MLFVVFSCFLLFFVFFNMHLKNKKYAYTLNYYTTVQNQWRAYNFEIQLRTPTLAVQVQLLLGLNTYLLFNTDILNLMWKTDEGEAESIVWLIYFLWRCWNGDEVVVWGKKKSYLGPAEITSFSDRNFSRGHILTCCINWIFLRFIFKNHCCFRILSLENSKKLRLSLV